VEYADPDPKSIADAIRRAGERENVEQLQSFISEFDWKQIAGDYADALKSIK
jgi:glycosyltransferase involved in cell wall biosynthesis